MKRLALILLALATSACGTTVQGAASSTSSAQGTDGLGGAGSSITAGGSTADAGAPDSAPSADSPGSGPVVPQPGTTTSSVGGGVVVGQAGNGLRATYPGVTATTISIGVSVSGTGSGAGEQVGQAFGVVGFSSAPERPLIETMIEHINSQGGILGRRLVPVWHTIDAADTRPYAEQSQEACATYTEDNKVFAHLNVVSDETFFASSAGSSGPTP
jgi:hypothetical protein